MTARCVALRHRRTVTARVLTGVIGLGLVAGCSGLSPSSSPGRTSPNESAAPSPTSTRTSTPPPSSRSATATPSTPSAAVTPPGALTCGQRLARALTPRQRIGQLIMVGLAPSGSPARLAAQVRAQRLGGVVYLGGWSRGATAVAAVSRRLQQASAGDLLLAADQEGGMVQQLRGPGFSAVPSARTQATLGITREVQAARSWATELRKAGVRVDLAPVADTVPRSLGDRNAPIGQYRRDFAPGDPMTNARYAAAFVRGMRAGGVAPTVKHFPGLGRVTNNTDTSSAGITDRATGPADPYLEPFRAAIAAGAPMVMVSSARYPRLDAHNAAMFSRPIITGLLREHLGFRGVVITDDVGASASVASLPVGQRATRFIAAGGDIVLTAVAGQAGTMIDSIAAEQAQNPAFGAQVTVATGHVLDLKAHLGLVRCP